MSNVKNVILKKKIEGVVWDLMVKTNSELVYTPEGKTVQTVLTEILASLDNKVEQSAIDTAISNLVDGAPEAYNTLKEISDYISTHKDEYTALQTLVGDKVTKSDYDTKMTALDTAISTINTTLTTLSTTVAAKLDKSVYDTKMTDIDTKIAALEAATGGEVTADDITETETKKIMTADERTKLASVGRFIVSETQPADLTENDIWAEVIPEETPAS